MNRFAEAVEKHVYDFEVRVIIYGAGNKAIIPQNAITIYIQEYDEQL